MSFRSLLMGGIAAAVWAMLIGCAGAPIERSLTFEDASANVYDAVLTVPAGRRPGEPGAAVLLLGGSLVTDMHWTVPGTLEVEGEPSRFTIDGHDTRDADTIAAALTERGFIVMRWSSIRRGDPEHAKNPAMAMPISFDASVDLSRRALALLRAQPEVDAGRIALVGHSLGGTRAWIIANEGVFAVVTLAGAYLAPVREAPSALAAGAWEGAGGHDADADAALSSAEFDAFMSSGATAEFASAAFADLDFDGSGGVSAWEMVAWSRLARWMEGDAGALSSEPFRGAYPWAVQRAAEMGIPWLAIFGGLDPISLHGPLVERLARNAKVQVEYWPRCGHQLSRQEGGLVGAIDRGVVERVAGFVESVMEE